MAQSNYNIPNESAPAVRAQLNAVFQSIATNNSGTTAPTTTFPHQWWYDTDQDILYKRNDTDSGWIVIAEFDTDTGKFLMPAAGLTQSQTQNPSSTDFGTVSGQRLAQAIAANISLHPLIATWSYSTNVSSVEFTNLGDWDYIEVEIIGLRAGDIGNTGIQVSFNNGATYQTSGYISTVTDSNGSGGATDLWRVQRINPLNALAYGHIRISSMSNSGFSVYHSVVEANGPGGRTASGGGRSPAGIVNAIRVTGSNISGGNINLYGVRRA